MVLSAQSMVVDKDGNKLDIKDGVYSHHTVITDVGKSAGFNPINIKCGSRMSLSPVAGWDSLNSMGGMGGGMGGAGGMAGHSAHGGAAPAAKPTSESTAGLTNALTSFKVDNGAALGTWLGGGLLSTVGMGLMGYATGMATMGWKALSAPEGLGVSILVGAGSEGTANVFTAMDSQVKTGFLLQKDDSLFITAEVINYDPQPKQIYLSLDYEYIEGDTEGYMDTAMGALNVDGCKKNGNEAMSESDHPSHCNKMLTVLGRTPNRQGRHIHFSRMDCCSRWLLRQSRYVHQVIRTRSMYLLDQVPHLHDGGTGARLSLNGKVVCSSEVKYGGSGATASVDGQKWETITSYGECNNAIKVRTGDRVIMEVDYDLTKHRL
jgi:hypothetical protein